MRGDLYSTVYVSMLSFSFSLTHTHTHDLRYHTSLLYIARFLDRSSFDLLSKRNASNERERRKRKEGEERKKSLRGIGLSRGRNALQNVSRFATRSIRRRSIRVHLVQRAKKDLREEAISNIVNKNGSRSYHLFFPRFFVYTMPAVYQKHILITILFFYHLLFIFRYFLSLFFFILFFFSFVYSFLLFVNPFSTIHSVYFNFNS